MRQVPMLPIVVPVAAATMAFLLWRLARRGRLTAPRAAVAVALCVYAAGIVANTVFPIFLDAPRHHSAWKVYVTPFTDYEVNDAVTNIVVFVPVGILVHLLMARPPWWRVIVVSTAISAAIELTQFLTGNLLGGGHLADVNDLIFNVAGAAIGLGALVLLVRVPGAAPLVDRFRWTPDA
ncbi:VanZ family protein [Aeromicrobium sp. Root472D3]|uniref:VanZ family protein n=1 Tax=Aeromicrobium sp. Root472D3 TaxID=1736540 RepID=UPI000A9200EB|nr:VanZ family protein [Aeromicrobium sp. Root472D3]